MQYLTIRPNLTRILWKSPLPAELGLEKILWHLRSYRVVGVGVVGLIGEGIVLEILLNIHFCCIVVWLA